MEETTPLQQSKSALVFSLEVLSVKGGDTEEMVISSPPPPVQRTEEGEELVCGTELTVRPDIPAGAVSMWSEGGEEQGELPFKVGEDVCFEPHLELDSEVEPQTEGIQETGQPYSLCV